MGAILKYRYLLCASCVRDEASGRMEKQTTCSQGMRASIFEVYNLQGTYAGEFGSSLFSLLLLDPFL